MNKRRQVAIYLTDAEREALKALADAEERTLGAYLRRVILAATQIKPASGDKHSGKK